MFCEFTIYDDLTFSHTDGEVDNQTKTYVQSILKDLTIAEDDVYLVKRIDDVFHVYSWEDDEIRKVWDEDVV